MQVRIALCNDCRSACRAQPASWMLIVASCETCKPQVPSMGGVLLDLFVRPHLPSVELWSHVDQMLGNVSKRCAQGYEDVLERVWSKP